jgi:hypothetical protein
VSREEAKAIAAAIVRRAAAHFPEIEFRASDTQSADEFRSALTVFCLNLTLSKKVSAASSVFPQ